MDYNSFLSIQKVLLVAPAGYGKTYVLSVCLQHTTGKSLVLTHTHAGVASIKQKLNEAGINPSKYNVETITSFAQKYVDSFYTGNEKPTQEDTKNYFSFIINEATSLLSNPLIKRVLKATYKGMFVDEYQDCSKEQHLMLKEVMDCFPTRIFGDPLQGIFNFNGELVDFEKDLVDFDRWPALDVPHRWNQVEAHELGLSLAQIRRQLEKGENINLDEYTDTIDVVIAQEKDFYNSQSAYSRALNSLRNEESLLILHPDTLNKTPRLKFTQRFKEINSIESIDDKDFYKLADWVDKLDFVNPIASVRMLSYKIFDKTGLDKWFNNTGFKNKREHDEKAMVLELERRIQSCEEKYGLGCILQEVEKLPDVRCTRSEVLRSLLMAIEISSQEGLSVLEGMREQRNNIRREGRRVEGKHIGTTLLTKGLQFDVVAMLDAHKFTSPEHLYVALTRCRKKLVIFSNTSVLKLN